jgi:hypothetical protein
VLERTSTRVTIADGLEAGDRLAVDELDRLADGVAVTVLEDLG